MCAQIKFMKNKILFYLLIYFNCFFCFSQKNQITIKYSKKINKIESKKNIEDKYKKAISNYKKSIEDNANNLFYNLFIDGYESNFLFANSLSKNDMNNRFLRIASNTGGTKGLFYLNIKDSIFINEKEFAGEEFNIIINKKKWTVLNETKNILKYKCFKAETFDIVKNSTGTYKFKVTAWFAPELPSFFGPANYFGLPGLILEVNNSKITLKATEINIRQIEKMNLKKLNTGKFYVESEFQNLVKKTIEITFGKN